MVEATEAALAAIEAKEEKVKQFCGQWTGRVH